MKNRKFDYQTDKAKETDPNRDKNDIKVSENCVFIDWNKLSMDELADYLENKWRLLSSGEALAIMKMVRFYRDNKELAITQPPPKPPLSRHLREGVIHTCELCGSSKPRSKFLGLFGKRYCINPDCVNSLEQHTMLENIIEQTKFLNKLTEKLK